MIQDRVTIDIDYYVPNAALKAIRAYYALSNHDAVYEVVTHVSTSGQGVHVEGHCDRILDEHDRDALRGALHDDEKRHELDEERGDVGHATDIYWSQKEGNDGERERVEDVWAALDRIEHNRASDYSRVKALALRGRKAVWDTHGLNRPSLAEEAA